MRLTKVRLKNFGKFKSFQWDISGIIAALLGPNGAGKSTILAAIRFGFRGELEDNLDTYIRDTYTPGTKPGEAEVEIEFRHNGQEGYIWRVIGKNKRLLRWDGQEYKSAKEVAETLESIFGADFSDVASAVFIEQYALQSFLREGAAGRERILARLLNVGDMAKIGPAVDKEIQQLTVGQEDWHLRLDEYKAERNAATTEDQQVAEQLSGMQDKQDAIDGSVRLIAALEDLERRRARADQLKLDVTGIQEQMNMLLNTDLRLKGVTLNDLETISEIEKNLNGLRSTLADQERKRQIIREAVGIEQERVTLADREFHAHETMRWIDAQIELHGLRGRSVQEISSALNTRQSYDRAAAELQQREALAKTTQDNLTNAETTLANLQSYHTDSAHADGKTALESQLATYRTDLYAAEAVLDMLRSLAEIDLSASAHTCPLCEGELHETHTVGLKSRVEAQAVLVREKSAVVTELTTKVDQITRQISEARTLVGSLTSSRNMYQEQVSQKRDELVRLKEQHPQVEAYSVTELQSKLQTAQELREKKINTDAELRTVAEGLSANATRKQSLDAGLLQAAQEVGEARLDMEISVLHIAISDATAKLQLLIPLAESRASIQTKLNEKTAQASEARSSVDTAYSAVSGMQLNLRKPQQDTESLGEYRQRITDDLGELRQQQNERQTLINRREFLAQQQVTIQIKIQQAEGKIKEQAKVAAIVEKLQLLKGIFHRTNLPQRYIDANFRKISDLTNVFLAEMGANFTVEPAEESATFNFVRSDIPDAPILHQSKLSGGQGTRLSIAFLAAVQQLVIPEIGFLILDEPSMGLDDEGKDALRQFLEGVGERGKGLDIQVIVVDHVEALESAMTSICRLARDDQESGKTSTPDQPPKRKRKKAVADPS